MFSSRSSNLIWDGNDILNLIFSGERNMPAEKKESIYFADNSFSHVFMGPDAR